MHLRHLSLLVGLALALPLANAATPKAAEDASAPVGASAQPVPRVVPAKPATRKPAAPQGRKPVKKLKRH